MFDYTVFGERLERLLSQNNMTQVELAEAIDVDKQTVYRWKKGTRKTPVDPKTISKLAKLFHVDREYLYDPQYTTPHQNQENIDKYLDAVYEKHKAFIDFIESQGLSVDLFPPHDFQISTHDNSTVSLLNDERMTLLEKKVSLFIQMQLI